MNARLLGAGVLLSAIIGVLCGASSALFLWLLDLATHTRLSHPTLIFALPVAGLGLGWLYGRLGEPIKGGTGLVIDALNRGGAPVPLRLAPLVLVGTVLTHLFGGSAGREGTAVQMGGSLADQLATRLKVRPALRQAALVAGVAGGFGAVFGTPIAGAVFGLELPVAGQLRHRHLVPAVVAALVGDATTRGLGIGHSAYPQAPTLAFTPLLALKWLAFGAAVAATAAAFVALTQAIKRHGARHLPDLSLRMAAGGVAVVALWGLFGGDYLGLGVPTILRAFEDPALPTSAFALKLLFTAVTIGAGFLGGEVTPLFFVGAALGNALAGMMGLPLGLAAGVGLAAVFGTAARTPLALAVMAVELLGVGILPHVALVMAVAAALARGPGLYGAQLRSD